MLSVVVFNPLRTLLVLAYFVRYLNITVMSSKIKTQNKVVVIPTAVIDVVGSRTD